ncbi:MAG: hypothetical protein Q9174_004542 [Haloplaca sp. 1 TL-2023]
MSGAGSSTIVKPIVVGLYGVPGTGKTYLLEQLRQELGEVEFAFYEGSQVIDKLVPDGLNAFKTMEEHEKVVWRQQAIQSIREECITSRRLGLVAGHLMFWDDEEQETPTKVCTQADLAIYSHIIYLDFAAEIVLQRRLNDTGRNRPVVSASHLRKWQNEEKMEFRRVCYEHQILFSLVTGQSPFSTKISDLLHDFKKHTEHHNLRVATSRLDKVVSEPYWQPNLILMIDGDKTLTPQDTGMLFWKQVAQKQSMPGKELALKTLFGNMGYTYLAFRQAMLLHEEIAEEDYDELCADVASEVQIHADFVSLLQCAATRVGVGAVLVSCGLRRVWKKVLEREGLSDSVDIIAAGRLGDGYVITPNTKGALVSHLQDEHGIEVCAFGDGPMDMEMLSEADEAIVVVGDEESRSKAMDAALTVALDTGKLRNARQTLLPSTAPPRLDTTKLPLIKLSDPSFVKNLLGRAYLRGGPCWNEMTDTSEAQLLSTPMRDAAVAGPALRKAHHRVGQYLAGDVARIVGLQKCPIKHVLGLPASGSQLFHENQTTIVALMRGGEPMASGVNDAFPAAMFVHAHDPEDLEPKHLEGQLTVILVDSVINSGDTIVSFVQHVRKLHGTIRIVVVAGVVQAGCLTNKDLDRKLGQDARVHIFALRSSETKFKGSGKTDTGNRLFNTTKFD